MKLFHSQFEFSPVLRHAMAMAVALLLVFLLQPIASYAQSTATLSGTVLDQAGAIVPNAKVDLTNQANGDHWQTVSNDSGYFAFASLSPGTYTVKVTATGFKPSEHKNISLHPGDVQSVPNIALKVGAISDSIEVNDVADEIRPTDSGERTAILTSKQIENLSLEGRDATELIRTLPGFAVFGGGGIANTGQDFTTISPTSGAVGQGYVGNGLPYRGGSDLISDGAHILDVGCNCGATQTVNGDMVSEVTVQTSNFGADSAKGPLVVNAVGKSGTASYHGESYIHIRSGSLNSLDPSFKSVLNGDTTGLVKKPNDRYLYPGGQIGGPVPKTGKKLTFFAGYEYFYQNGFPMQGLSAPGLLEDIVPTKSMRQGLFDPTLADNMALCSSGSNPGQQFCAQPTYWDPTANAGAGANVTGNTVPSSLFDPGGLALLGAIPQPNSDPTKTNGFNLVVPENLDQNGFMFHTREDYSISDNNKLYVAYNMQKETDQSPIHLWWTPPNSIPFPGGMSSKDNSQTISGHFVHVFSSSLTNDLSAAYAYINYPLVRNNPNAWGITANSYPYQGVFKTGSPMMPSISNGYWIAGVPFMDQGDIFGGGAFVWKKWVPSVEDKFTKVYKTHTIKTGFYWEWTENDQGAFTHPNGEATFTPYGPYNGYCQTSATVTNGSCGANNPYVNLLLGATAYGGGFSQTNINPLDNLYYKTYSGYIQDDWKVAKRLTLNLGVRLDHLGAWQPTASPNGIAAWTGNLSSGGGTNLPGFDWNGRNSSIPVTGRNIDTVTAQPRVGIAYDLRGNAKTVLRGGFGEYGYRDQWNDYAGSVETANGVRTYNSPNPITLAAVDAVGKAGGATGTTTSTGSGVLASDTSQPLTRDYNFTIDQELPWKTRLDVGYVGSRTINQPLEGNAPVSLQDLNVIPLGGAFAGGKCANPPCNVGTIPASVYPLGAQYGINAVNVLQHRGKSNYNGLQLSWLKQTGRINYNLNYTWSKALGTLGTGQLNGLTPDATNINNDYGVLSIDRSHVFNFSYTFQSGNPVRGNAFLRGVANGWNISGISTWQSGPNLNSIVTTNFNIGGTGPDDPTAVDKNGLPSPGHGIGISNANYIGTPNINLQPTLTCDPTSNLGPHQYVNGSCFGIPNGGTNGPYHYPYIHGPAYFNSDLAVFKSFKITEAQSFELRLSAFNFLNHPLWSFNPNQHGDLSLNYKYSCTTFSSVTNAKGTVGGFCLNGNGSYAQTNPIFGVAQNQYGRRVAEISLKYKF